MKKFIALLTIFSLVLLSGNLMAKKRGDDLIIQKIDGQKRRGELIAVKEHSLLLLLSGVDVTVDIDDIKVITIVKKDKAFLGLVLGLLIGGGGGALVSNIIYPENGMAAASWVLIGGLCGAIGGVIVGAGSDKIIKIEGKSPEEVKEVLDKLRKKARIPDYQ